MSLGVWYIYGVCNEGTNYNTCLERLRYKVHNKIPFLQHSHSPSFGPVMITVAVVSAPSLVGSEGLLMETSNSSMPSNVVSSMICGANKSL